MKTFISGSRAYGTPREDSDIDLVIVCTASEAQELRDRSDSNEATKAFLASDLPLHYSPAYFGKLNLIIFCSDLAKDMERYKGWVMAHEELMAERPVTRERAIEVHKKYKSGVNDK